MLQLAPVSPTGPQDCFEILPVRKLKKVEKHCSRVQMELSVFAVVAIGLPQKMKKNYS